jgi:hypothetical protein
LNIFPVSMVSIRPSASDCSARRSASFRSSRPRSVPLSLPQGPFSAAWAASTARLTSPSVALGIVAQTCPVAGLWLSKLPPSEDATQSPSMNIR